MDVDVSKTSVEGNDNVCVTGASPAGDGSLWKGRATTAVRRPARMIKMNVRIVDGIRVDSYMQDG